VPAYRIWLVILWCVLLSAGVAVAQESDDLATVTYLTRSTVYLSAGSASGIVTGQLLHVVRDGVVITDIRPETVSTRRAACTPTDPGVEIEVGDQILMGGDDIENGVAVTGESLLRMAGSSSVFSGSQSKREESPLRAFGLRGRLGVRYLAVQDRTGFGQDFSQPALDLRLEGRDLGGTAFEVLADVRTRRTYRTSALGDHTTEGRSRVYRASVGLAPSQGRLALRVGRQFAAELPSLGIYDGVAASARGERWSVGILSGTQPHELTFGYSSMVREHAGFFQLRANRDARQVWSVTAGVVASYADGIINREYQI